MTEGVDVFYLLDFVGPKDFAVELSHKARWYVFLFLVLSPSCRYFVNL